ncbi:hypothetical protein [Priestia megaterium]|uniref:hypothetical protein n=1 Tax=Priestia megaterium TaxID=1404 RepID=UPI000BFD11CC|nr:hypothetical protein [Priestia megaterium]PGO60720.1 hypothetical protein CN981_09285 [Priestia megaterium]
MTKEIKEVQNTKNVLTFEGLKEEVKVLDEVQEFTVKINESDYILTHDVVFRKTKQQKLLEDMLRFFSEVTEDNVEVLDYATPYTALLIIKHFTSLDVPDEIDEALALLEVLVDLDALAKIVNALPEDEVVKVYELLNTALDGIRENMEEAEKEAEAIADQLENEEVKELITGNGEETTETDQEQTE